MTLSSYLAWWKRNWAHSGLLLALYLTVVAVVFVLPDDLPVFLLLMMTPLYMLHEAEEYLFPGGFIRFFNRDVFGVDSDDEPIDEDFSFFVNIGLIWILLPTFALLASWRLDLGLWIPYFTLFAGIAHVPLAIKARKLYNPGLVVSLVLNVPAGAGIVAYFARTGHLENPWFNVHLLIGLALNLMLPVLGALRYRSYRNAVRASAPDPTGERAS